MSDACVVSFDMRLTCFLLLFCASAGAQNSMDLRTGVFRGLPVTYKVVDDLAILEDDIVLGSAAEMDGGSGKSSTSKDALIVPGDRFRWTNATIPYEIDAALPNPQRVRDAVA